MHQESGRDGEHEQPEPWAEGGAPIVLILVGLIASGKSTFAKALEEQIPQFRRCNQDDLGSRAAVEKLARQSLQSGRSVCIDRTNFDATQRAHWVKIGRELGTQIWCLFFDAPLNVCKERLQYRTDHPTIRSVAQGEQVLYRFANMFSPPTAEEGYDRIYILKPQEHLLPSYTRDKLLAILVQIANSPPPVVASVQLGIRQFLPPGDHNESVSQGGADLSHNNAARRPGSTRARTWAGAGKTRGNTPRAGSLPSASERGFSGYNFQQWRGNANRHGRGRAQGASTTSSTLSSAGFNASFGIRGRGYSANTNNVPRGSNISSSWRRDSCNNGQQLRNGQAQPELGSGISSSLLTSPERQSQSNSFSPGDAHNPDVACEGDGSPHCPFTID